MTRPAALLAGVIGAALAGVAAGGPAQDYTLFCMGCHGAEAQGVPGKVPPLARTVSLFMRSAAGRNYVLRVPGAANSALPDAQLAAVLNWLAARYGSDAQPPATPFTTEEVARTRHLPLADVKATRREVVRELAARGAAPPADY